MTIDSKLFTDILKNYGDTNIAEGWVLRAPTGSERRERGRRACAVMGENLGCPPDKSLMDNNKITGQSQLSNFMRPSRALERVISSA